MHMFWHMHISVCYLFVSVSMQRKRTGMQGTKMFVVFVTGCGMWVDSYFLLCTFLGFPQNSYNEHMLLETKDKCEVFLYFLRGIERGLQL